MSIESAPILPTPSAGAAPSQPWPAPGAAWYAMAIFTITLMFLQLDQNTIALLQQSIKADLNLSDLEFSLLLGPAVAIFYALVGVPLARLVDTRTRNVILAIAIAVWSLMTVACGLAQNFSQLMAARIGIGAGGAINGPATYSMIADYFPREKLNRAISVLQIGFISGVGLASIFGGLVIGAVSRMEPQHWGPLVIRSWQMVFVVVGAPGVIVSLLMALTVKEPARRGVMAQATVSVPFGEVLKFLLVNWRIYGPMMLGLAIGGIETAGTLQWRPALMQRTYGWSAQDVGVYSGLTSIPFMFLGVAAGAWLTDRLARKHADANLRVVVIGYMLALPFQILGPLAPNGWMALLAGGVALMTTLIGAAPQNAALQTITPGPMRGQVTALYLFVFTVIGQGMGPPFIAAITNLILKDEAMIRWAMAGSALIMSPLALAIIWAGVKPYGQAVERVKLEEQAQSAG
jgi:MFS family permease